MLPSLFMLLAHCACWVTPQGTTRPTYAEYGAYATTDESSRLDQAPMGAPEDQGLARPNPSDKPVNTPTTSENIRHGEDRHLHNDMYQGPHRLYGKPPQDEDVVEEIYYHSSEGRIDDLLEGPEATEDPGTGKQGYLRAENGLERKVDEEKLRLYTNLKDLPNGGQEIYHQHDQNAMMIPLAGPEVTAGETVDTASRRMRQGPRDRKSEIHTHRDRSQGNGESENATMDQAREGDEVLFTQTSLPHQAWCACLEAIRRKLESMDPQAKIQTAGTLLRLVDWHSTDHAQGYFLGHMGDEAADITSLLVVALDGRDSLYAAGGGASPSVDGMWAEIERFLPRHAGSARARGQRVPPELPCVMIQTKWAPSTTPNSTQASTTGLLTPSRKKRCMSLEIQIQQQGTTRACSSEQVELDEGPVELRIRMEEVESERGQRGRTAEETMVAQHGVRLPPAGPGPLAEHGISFSDYQRLRHGWLGGSLTWDDIRNTHGPAVVRTLKRRWEVGEEEEDAQLLGDARDDQGEPRCEEDQQKKDGNDETSYLHLWHLSTVLIAGKIKQGQAMEFLCLELRIARDQLGRMRREGWTRQQQSSALYVLIQNRAEGLYMDRFPHMMADLDLPVDVNLNPTCLPAGGPVMEWIEAELWGQFLDWFEGNIGAETESLQALRGRPTMSEEEMETWRQWAEETPTTSRTRERSRSPRRTPTTSSGPPADETSFMHRGGAGNT